MPLPKKLSLPRDLDPRLVTKTSLQNPKQAIALLIILWYAAGKPGSYSYGKEIGSGEKGQTGILDEQTSNLVLNLLDSTFANLQSDGSKRDLLKQYSDSVKKSLAVNALFKSQIEALNAAFQLIWHLASFSFDDKTKNLSAERTGGLRFRKHIRFTSNMDLIEMIAQPDETSVVGVAFNWLTSGTSETVPCDPETEEKLKRTLAAFAETSFYKTMKGEDGVVYAPSGIYDAIVEGASIVSLVNEGAEAQGTTRILKSAIKDGLNPMLVSHGSDEVARNDDHTSDELAAYSERAKNTLAISSIKLTSSDVDVEEDDEIESSTPRNLIYFGAPGTGKSFQLEKRARDIFGGGEDAITRVTFHPDYTYAQFVGCYKPVSGVNDEGKHEVYYDFVPGPFTDVYVMAKKHPEKKYALLIEEINRANPAAVFGDVFQLLDRNKYGKSEYPVHVSQDLGKYLYRELGLVDVTEDDARALESETCFGECVSTMAIPDNMYLWATMNSADQGVFPMDTAFKRRWDFHYMGIDEGQDGVAGYEVPVQQNGMTAYVKWNDLRKAINSLLIENKVNEDKLIGPYFIKETALADPDSFTDTFMNKVLLYLFEDAGKMRRASIFNLGTTSTYSQVCAEFKDNGLSVFKGLEDIRYCEVDSAEPSTGDTADATDGE